MATNVSQLIFVVDANDANGDGGIDYINSGGTTATSFAPDAPFAANPGFQGPWQIAADTAAGIYYVIDPNFTGDGSSGGKIVMAKLTDTSQHVMTEYTVPSNPPPDSFGEAWALAIDTTNHVLYLSQDTFNSGDTDFGTHSGIASRRHRGTASVECVSWPGRGKLGVRGKQRAVRGASKPNAERILIVSTIDRQRRLA